jgi:hypothetical protein
MATKKSGERVSNRKTAPSRAEAEMVAEQLNNMMATAREIQETQTEAERMYYTLRQDPDLFKAVQEKSKQLTGFRSSSEILEELQKEISKVKDRAKLICRQFTEPTPIAGWVFKSSSGGEERIFHIEKMCEAWRDIVIEGEPLVDVKFFINPKIWNAAVEKKMIDEAVAIRDGVLEKKMATRRASLTLEQAQQGGDEDEQ